MGWAEDRARDAVQVSKEPIVKAPEPGGLAGGYAPSEFLETVARGMLVDCMKGAAMVQAVLSPPSIVGPSGQAAARPDPVATLLATQMRVLHAQAAVLDLLLTFLSGRPELRPVKTPENGSKPNL